MWLYSSEFLPMLVLYIAYNGSVIVDTALIPHLESAEVGHMLPLPVDFVLIYHLSKFVQKRMGHRFIVVAVIIQYAITVDIHRRRQHKFDAFTKIGYVRRIRHETIRPAHFIEHTDAFR